MHHWTAAVDDATDEWLPQWWHDLAWSTLFSITVSVHPDQWCMFCTPSLALFPHAVIKHVGIMRIWRPQLRWDKFWSFFLWQCSGSTSVMNISSFTRECRDIIQVRWETFTYFGSKFIKQTLYQISSETPEFCRRYYRKHFGLFFPDTLYKRMHRQTFPSLLYRVEEKWRTAPCMAELLCLQRRHTDKNKKEKSMTQDELLQTSKIHV